MNGMDKAGWVTALITPAKDEEGQTTQVVVGLKENATGGLVFSLRIGEDGNSVTMLEPAALQHMSSERIVMHEKLVREGRMSRSKA